MAAGLGLCLAGAGIDRPAAAGQFDGVTVNVMTQTGADRRSRCSAARPNSRS